MCIRDSYKYEFIFQVVYQDKVELNQNVVLVTWELVDWLDRTRKILGYGAGLKKKNPAYILAIRELNKGQDFRNILQHFDNFIKDTTSSSYAPLGAVSAIHYMGEKEGKAEFRTLVYNAGSLKSDTEMGSVKLPKKMKETVDHVTLQFEDKYLNISEIIYKLLEFYKSLRFAVEERYPKT